MAGAAARMRPFSVALLVLAARPVAAQQIPLSQRGGVTQMVGGTRIEIRYSRPVARGRELFGKLVPWGKVWCPGADTATTIAFSAPVDRKSTRLNSSHLVISYAVFCLKKKKN